MGSMVPVKAFKLSETPATFTCRGHRVNMAETLSFFIPSHEPQRGDVIGYTERAPTWSTRPCPKACSSPEEPSSLAKKLNRVLVRGVTPCSSLPDQRCAWRGGRPTLPEAMHKTACSTRRAPLAVSQCARTCSTTLLKARVTPGATGTRYSVVTSVRPLSYVYSVLHDTAAPARG